MWFQLTVARSQDTLNWAAVMRLLASRELREPLTIHIYNLCPLQTQSMWTGLTSTHTVFECADRLWLLSGQILRVTTWWTHSSFIQIKRWLLLGESLLKKWTCTYGHSLNSPSQTPVKHKYGCLHHVCLVDHLLNAHQQHVQFSIYYSLPGILVNQTLLVFTWMFW